MRKRIFQPSPERPGSAHQRTDGTYWLRTASVVAILFGLLTIREGGSVLYSAGADGSGAGQYVPFVVWFNFLAGFAYVAAGVGFWFRQPWTPRLSLAIAGATMLVFMAFGVHVAVGGGYEIRTVVAMSLRIAVWVAMSFIAYRFIGGAGPQKP